VAVAMVAIADLRRRCGGGWMAMPAMAVADLGRRRGRRWMAMTMTPIADLSGGGRRLHRMAMTVMAAADLGRRGGCGAMVVAVMDTRLSRAAGKGDRGGDEGGGPDANRLGVDGSDHAIS
jgi:hypothetical protein